MYVFLAKRYCVKRSEAFIAEKSPQEHEKGFLWLHLNETDLKQWESFCLRRFLNEKVCSLLSSQKIVHALRDILMKSKKIRTVPEKHFSERAKDVQVTLEQEGPACTIKVEVLKEDLNGCCNSRYQRLLFHGDFTLALHCSFWPDEAKGRSIEFYYHQFIFLKVLKLKLKKFLNILPFLMKIQYQHHYVAFRVF